MSAGASVAPEARGGRAMLAPVRPQRSAATACAAREPGSARTQSQ